VEAGALLADYRGDAAAADAQYKDKSVAITGVVSAIEPDFDAYVTLGTGDPSELQQVQVYVKKSEVPKLAALKKGDKITVRGTVKELAVNVIVRDALLQ
jgi:hypothetical protein